MPETNFDVEWVASLLQTELRWGIHKRKTGAFINSTRVATITRDVDRITDAGAQETFVVKFATLFDPGYLTGDKARFNNIADAKLTILSIVAKVFDDMHHATIALRNKPR